ncbi:hypothetical protein LTR94_034733, partial [Friedmanniomyces endolithicus]
MNAGSSSLKFALYDADDLGVLTRAAIDCGAAGSGLRSLAGPMSDVFRNRPLPADDDIDARVAWIVDVVRHDLPVDLVGAGHRIVHGGVAYAEPVRFTEEIGRALAKLSPLAPAHQPHNLAGAAA